MEDQFQSYDDAFGQGVNRSRKKTRRALKRALKIRKFEINLYWKRAAYFWTFIAAAFGGYLAILGSEHLDDKDYLAFIVSCVGLLFTWAWFLANRGSKFWQENWENHVDMLEDAIVGPLYKTILHRPKETRMLEKLVTAPMTISVSKVNQWVSAFTLAIWFVLVWHTLPPFSPKFSISWRHVFVGVLTLLAGAIIPWQARTHLGDHSHVMFRRKTRISGIDQESSRN